MIERGRHPFVHPLRMEWMRWAGQHLVLRPAGLGAATKRAIASFHEQHGAAMCCCCRPAVPLVLTFLQHMQVAEAASSDRRATHGLEDSGDGCQSPG